MSHCFCFFLYNGQINGHQICLANNIYFVFHRRKYFDIRMTLGWVNDERMCISGWTITLSNVHCLSYLKRLVVFRTPNRPWWLQSTYTGNKKFNAYMAYVKPGCARRPGRLLYFLQGFRALSALIYRFTHHIYDYRLKHIQSITI